MTRQSNVLPFNFNSHTIGVLMRDGEPWFIATEICAALNYANSSDAIATHLDDDERMTIADSDSHLGKRGGRRLLTIISESGLYALVLRSRKPEARKFAKWVTSEVLPSIRKTGSYSRQGTVLNDYQLYQVFFVLSHFTSLYKIYKSSRLYDHLKGLGSRIGIEMYDHFRDGMSGGVRQLDSSLASQFEAVCKRLRVHYISQHKHLEDKHD